MAETDPAARGRLGGPAYEPVRETMKVVIIDCGMGNLGSIRQLVEECGGDPWLSSDPGELLFAGRIILPGIGPFHDGMAVLSRLGFPDAIREAVRERGTPLLGIGLGMQLLGSLGKGTGDGGTAGLDLVPGTVERLFPVSPPNRLPHVGWNEVHQVRPSILFEGIPDGADYYFSHSDHLTPEDPEHVIGMTPYCIDFVSAVRAGRVFGVQFHPEKSGRPGMELLKNFLRVEGG